MLFIHNFSPREQISAFDDLSSRITITSAMKIEITVSSNAPMKANNPPVMIEGLICSIVTIMQAVNLFTPKLRATSSCVMSCDSRSLDLSSEAQLQRLIVFPFILADRFCEQEGERN